MHRTLLMLPLAALALAAQAQTTRPAARPAAKPVAKPAANQKSAPAKPAPKPVAKPAAAAPVAAPATPAPAAKPAPAVRVTVDAAPGGGPFKVGTTVLSVGVGLGSRYAYGAGLFGGSSSSTPAFSVAVERGIAAVGPGYIGVGGIVGYQHGSYTYDFLGSGGKWGYHDAVLMARGAFHYPAAPQLDAYAGVGLGVRFLRDSYDDGVGGSSASSSVFAATGIFLGARYFFSPRLGGFAELGYDQSFIKIGLSAKL